MFTPLAIGVLAAAAWAVFALAALHLRAKSFGKRVLFAPPAGDPRRGVVYAFGKGMSPGAKESARTHLPTWAAGMAYHAGVFAALGHLGLRLLGIEPAFALRVVLQCLLAAGTACGAALLLKRGLTPALRRLSAPDDYLSNGLATLFTAASLARTLSPAAAGPLFVSAILLFGWIPVGKIRHCFFFFTTRYHSAVHFGRRGTFPPAHGEPVARGMRNHG